MRRRHRGIGPTAQAGWSRVLLLGALVKPVGLLAGGSERPVQRREGASAVGAQVQLELLRQQNEIIRLLGQLGRGRGDGR
jgi:hypothetical protein